MRGRVGGGVGALVGNRARLSSGGTAHLATSPQHPHQQAGARACRLRALFSPCHPRQVWEGGTGGVGVRLNSERWGQSAWGRVCPDALLLGGSSRTLPSQYQIVETGH